MKRKIFNHTTLEEKKSRNPRVSMEAKYSPHYFQTHVDKPLTSHKHILVLIGTSQHRTIKRVDQKANDRESREEKKNSWMEKMSMIAVFPQSRWLLCCGISWSTIRVLQIDLLRTVKGLGFSHPSAMLSSDHVVYPFSYYLPRVTIYTKGFSLQACPKHPNLFKSNHWSKEWFPPLTSIRLVSAFLIQFFCQILTKLLLRHSQS